MLEASNRIKERTAMTDWEKIAQELAEALEPFAMLDCESWCCEHWPDNPPDEDCEPRRAREVLAKWEEMKK
jgi:hypothetical protein